MKTTKTIYLIPVLAFLLVMLQRAWLSEKAPVTTKGAETQKIGGLGKIKNFNAENDIIVSTDKITVNISKQGGAITGFL